MRTAWLKYWEALRSSYWFIPACMAVGTVALAFGMTALDRFVGPDWADEISWLYAYKPDGARAVLATIAGSMIGVAGVTFSITIVAVSFASAQFGPRILTNFMRDTGNQVTLGTFIATFLYGLLVLRTVRSADELPVGAEQVAAVSDVTGAFVPRLAILGALVLAVASLGVLIYFIHHIPESIHVSNVIAEIGRDLNGHIEKLFPEDIGKGAAVGVASFAGVPDGLAGKAAPVCVDGYGYIQYIDSDALLEVAGDHDLVLYVRYRPGDFISPGKPLVLARPADALTEQAVHRIQDAFAWGRHRTTMQDIRFLVDELVEIAARALSPGVNDPFTAMGCLDWLGSALLNLATRATPDACRYDEDGELRVVAEPATFETFAALIFGQMRPYVRADRNAALYTLKIMEDAGVAVRLEAHRAVLRQHAAALLEGAVAVLPQPEDHLEIRRRYEAVLDLLDHPQPVALS